MAYAHVAGTDEEDDTKDDEEAKPRKKIKIEFIKVRTCIIRSYLCMVHPMTLEHTAMPCCTDVCLVVLVCARFDGSDDDVHGIATGQVEAAHYLLQAQEWYPEEGS